MGSVIDLIVTYLNTALFRVLRVGRALAKVFRVLRVTRGLRLAKSVEGAPPSRAPTAGSSLPMLTTCCVSVYVWHIVQG